MSETNITTKEGVLQPVKKVRMVEVPADELEFFQREIRDIMGILQSNGKPSPQAPSVSS